MDLDDTIKQRRAEQGINARHPKRVNLSDRIAELPSEGLGTDEEFAKAEREAKRVRLASECQSALRSDLGRFSECRLGNYQRGIHDRQDAVVGSLVVLCKDITAEVGKGTQLCLWGTVGTGKDHLAAAVLKVAASQGISCRWTEARDFCRKMAGAYSAEGGTQDKVLKEWGKPTVLCLSDPVAPEMRPNHREYLEDLIRYRYHRGRLTWSTMNVRKLGDAQAFFGADTWSRLSQNQLALECRWDDYRASSV